MQPNDMMKRMLLQRYFLGEASANEIEELERKLETEAEFRRQFVLEAGYESGLREIALERRAKQEGIEEKVISFPVIRFGLAVAAAVAAAMFLAITLVSGWLGQREVVADLVSSEDAAWESSLPTEPGSYLSRGYMKLTAGIAMIRFRSGAEMMLEAPAQVALESRMRAELVSGAVVMNVPESAVGFVLKTPEGRVVDHGTAFAVNVDPSAGRATFEVIEGEISVHHAASGNEVRLLAEEGASIENDKLVTYEGPFAEEDEKEESPELLRIGTNGRCYSVIRANKEKWLHADKLLVKRRNKPANHERRAFFAFDLSGVDFANVASAQIRLNQVPSGIGFASRLPKVSNIAVFGMTNHAKDGWEAGVTWEEGPTAGDGIMLGNLQLPRSKQRGSRIFGGEALLEFLRSNDDGEVTFILDGEIDAVTGERVPSLVHAFASDMHPESAGPLLELTFTDLGAESR